MHERIQIFTFLVRIIFYFMLEILQDYQTAFVKGLRSERKKLFAAFRRMLDDPNRNGLFFDSSKYELIIHTIITTDDQAQTDDDFNMEVEEIETKTKISLRGTFNRKAFNAVKNDQKRQKTNHLMLAINDFANKETTTFIKVLCYLGARHCHTAKNKRTLVALFKQIGEEEEKFNHPKKISLHEALAIKHSLNQSKRAYHVMRNFFQDKVQMPEKNILAKFATSLTPTAHSFMNGARYDLKDCLVLTIKDVFDILNIKHDETPKAITFIGAIGEDGSGSHGQRQGKDIRMNTTNRIIGGFRVGRIINEDTKELMYQEMSQSAVSQRPTMVVPGKESREHVQAIWNQIQKEVKEVETTSFEYNETEVKVTVKFTLQGDNKERKQLTGKTIFLIYLARILCYLFSNCGHFLNIFLQFFLLHLSGIY